jgi:hypothetical protein
VQDFLDEHRALILRHARAHVNVPSDKITPEDVAREIELELTQLGARGLTAASIDAPDAYVRSLVKHAAGRARRRRTLVEQLAAGDDLEALANDLGALDADLAPLPEPASPGAMAARATLEKVKDALSPSDALVFALLIEDDSALDDVAAWLGVSLPEAAAARDRVLETAKAQGIEGEKA